MSRESTLMLFGILIALAPFSGLPHEWLSIIVPALGLIVSIIGYSLRGRRLDAPVQEA